MTKSILSGSMAKFLPVLLLLLLMSIDCRSADKKAVGVNKDATQGWTKGKGIAQIYQNDIALAKDRALRAAKRDAIRRKLGELIRSKTVTDSGIWVKGEVSANTEGLVKDYKITSENQLSQIYKINILADVYESDLIDMVENLLKDWEKPVMFGIITEVIQSAKKEESPYFNNALQGLEKYFLEKGFILNKTSNFQKFLKPPVQITKISKLLSQKGIEVDFDLLVFGSSKCQSGGKVKYKGFQSDFVSSQVTAAVSVFDVHTKRLVASASGREAFPHLDFITGCAEAFSKKLMPKLGHDLFGQLIKKWKKEYGNGRPLPARNKRKYSL